MSKRNSPAVTPNNTLFRYFGKSPALKKIGASNGSPQTNSENKNESPRELNKKDNSKELMESNDSGKKLSIAILYIVVFFTK